MKPVFIANTDNRKVATPKSPVHDLSFLRCSSILHTKTETHRLIERLIETHSLRGLVDGVFQRRCISKRSLSSNPWGTPMRRGGSKD